MCHVTVNAGSYGHMGSKELTATQTIVLHSEHTENRAGEHLPYTGTKKGPCHRERFHLILDRLPVNVLL